MLELIIFIRDNEFYSTSLATRHRSNKFGSALAARSVQAMALSHLVVLNSPLEDAGSYAFQRKPGFLLGDVFLNEVAKFAVGVGHRYGVIVVCHRINYSIIHLNFHYYFLNHSRLIYT